MRWLGADGYRVDVVHDNRSGSDLDWLMVKQRGVLRGQYPTVAEMSEAHPGLVETLVEQ
jgi:hypothetical protein